MLAVLQGDVQFACVPGVAVMPHVKSGKLQIGGSTQDLANFMQNELRVMTSVIKRTGIKVD